MVSSNTTTIVVRGDTRDADRAIKGLQGRMDGFGSRLSSIRAPLLGITAALGGMAVAATKTFTGFDASMQKIVGLVGLSQEAVDGMRKSVLGLAGTTAQAPSDLADALFAVTSAGQRGEEAIATLTNAAQASAAGLGDTKDVALTLVGALQNYGAAGLTAAEATDILVGTVQAGNLEASELAGSLSRVIPIASAAGVGFEQIGGAVALLTRATIPTSEAVTGLRAAILAVNAPTTEAVAAFKEAGISTKDLNDALQSGGLIAALELVEEAAGGNSTMFRKMLGSVEALTVSNVLLNASSQDISETFGEVATATGKNAAAFGVAAETDAFKFQQAMVDIKIALLDIGNVVGPVMAEIARAVGVAISAFDKLPGPIKTSVVVLGGITLALAAIGLALPPVIAGIGVLGAVAGASVVGWVGFQLAVLSATGVVIGFNIATLGIVAAAAAIIAGLVLLVMNWDAVKDAIGRALDKLGHWKFALLAMAGPIGLVIGAVILLKDELAWLLDKISAAVGWLKFWGGEADDASDSAQTLAEETTNVTNAMDDLGVAVEETAEKTGAAFARMADLETIRTQSFVEDMQAETRVVAREREKQTGITEEQTAEITALITESRQRMGDAVQALTEIENVHTNTVLENMQAMAREADRLHRQRMEAEATRLADAAAAADVMVEIESRITMSAEQQADARARAFGQSVTKRLKAEADMHQARTDMATDADLLIAALDAGASDRVAAEAQKRLATLKTFHDQSLNLAGEFNDALQGIGAPDVTEVATGAAINAAAATRPTGLLGALAAANIQRRARIDEIEGLLGASAAGSARHARLTAELAKLQGQRSVSTSLGDLLAGGAMPTLPELPQPKAGSAAASAAGSATTAISSVTLNNYGTIIGPDEMEEVVVAAISGAEQRGMM